MEARYRLAPMRDVRARDEHARRGDLAGAVGEAQVRAGDVADVARRLARVRAAITEAWTTRERRLAQGCAAGTIAHLEHHLRRLRRDLDAVHDELARAETRHRGQLDAVDLAQGRFSHARAEREVIERHFAAWRTARRKLADRRED
ncbi:MAG: hypothetical protein ABIY55_03170 [Kofleriaceae bacterium]